MATTSNLYCIDQSQQVVADQHDLCAFACDFGSRTHCDTDGCLHECWRVVDSITDHCDSFAATHELPNDLALLIGENFRVDHIDPNFLSN
jgi:hypothetical protein